MVTTLATAPTKKPIALRRPKAGEALPAYGLPHGSGSLRAGLRARDRAVVDRALSILGSYLRTSGSAFDSPDIVKDYLRLQLAGEPCEHFAVLYLDS